MIKSYIHARNQFFNSLDIIYRTDELMSIASNRYQITVKVAKRAKRRRYEEFENFEEEVMKQVIRSIIEVSDELTQPEILNDRIKR